MNGNWKFARVRFKNIWIKETNIEKRKEKDFLSHVKKLLEDRGQELVLLESIRSKAQEVVIKEGLNVKDEI